MPRPRPDAAATREPVRAGRAGRDGGRRPARTPRRAGRAGLAGLLAVALIAAPARASGPAPGPNLARETAADATEGEAAASEDAAIGDQAAQLAVAAQRRFERGDVAGAIARWQQALAAVPVTQANAHRRAGLTLAIAAAHVELAVGSAAQRHLRAALEVLDAHLAALDPTDDENRVAVEQRRAELSARLAALRPTVVASAPEPGRLPPDRRLQAGGGALLGLGVGGLVLLGAGLAVGEQADLDLADAVGRAGDDPRRAAAIAEARTHGLRANRLAIAGGVLGGALLIVGAALLIAGRAGRAPGRGPRPTLGGAGLLWRF